MFGGWSVREGSLAGETFCLSHLVVLRAKHRDFCSSRGADWGEGVIGQGIHECGLLKRQLLLVITF